MKIKACIKCGSTRLHIPTIHNSSPRLGIGTIAECPTIAGILICDECLYEGIPVVFESEEEHQKFVHALKKKR
ncbi:MAG: hypothetical protein AB1485_07050 [Candidatus Thermoplasmatota archaeon]